MLLHRFSRPLTWALPLALCAGLLLQPDAAAQAAKNGLLLCGNLVVPALFPFFILSSLLVSTGGAARLGRLLSGVMGRLFHQTGTSASALVLGFLGGYPVGAKTVCTLYEEKLCDRTQAEHLLIDTDFTMGQVAQMIGCTTSSRFAELFKKSTGILPMEYRKLARKK